MEATHTIPTPMVGTVRGAGLHSASILIVAATAVCLSLTLCAESLAEAGGANDTARPVEAATVSLNRIDGDNHEVVVTLRNPVATTRGQPQPLAIRILFIRDDAGFLPSDAFVLQGQGPAGILVREAWMAIGGALERSGAPIGFFLDLTNGNRWSGKRNCCPPE